MSQTEAARLWSQAIDLGDFDYAHEIQSQGPTVCPEFNGLTEETFNTGTSIIGQIERLTPDQRSELTPHLVSHVAMLHLGDKLAPYAYKDLAESLEEQSRLLRNKASSIESENIRQAELAKNYIED